MQTLPSVAVVILNWNGRNFLQQFLPSVLASTYTDLRVIVADNASTDDSIKFVQQTFPSVELLTSKENYGFAKGYNFFLQQVKADYYVLLNSDVEVTTNWIEPIIELMEADKTIAACQPKILAYSQKDTFEYAGASGGWIDALGYPFSRGRVFDVLEKDHGQYNDATEIFWASGASLFIRSEQFHAMHGFDEFFFAHQEEIDLCWRLQRSGYKIVVCPKSVVYHVGGGTLPTGSSQKVYLNFRNNLVMICKNMSWSELWWKFPLRIGLDTVSAWKELLSGKPGYWLAVVKAHVAFIGWVFGPKRTSTGTQTSGVSKTPQVLYSRLKTVYQGSVVWQYFIRKKKIFSEIVKPV